MFIFNNILEYKIKKFKVIFINFLKNQIIFFSF